MKPRLSIQQENHTTPRQQHLHTKTTNPCTQRKRGVVKISVVNCKIKLYVIDRQIETKIQNKINKEKMQQGILRFLIYDLDRPGGHSFHQRLLSRKQHTVGKQITVGQLIEKQIIITISKAMIMYIGITSETSRPTPACIYYY